MARLENRRAPVSGGGKRLGRAIARRLAAEGADVTVVDLNDEKGRECADPSESAGGGSARFVRANVAKREDIGAAVRAAVLDGRLDVLVNAAQCPAMPKALPLVTDKDWELSEATGPNATSRFMRAAHPLPKASGRVTRTVLHIDGGMTELSTMDYSSHPACSTRGKG